VTVCRNRARVPSPLPVTATAAVAEAEDRRCPSHWHDSLAACDEHATLFETLDPTLLRNARTIYEEPEDVLALLCALADPRREKALAALHRLDCNFSDQLVLYVEATPLVVPYLLELLTCELPIRRELVSFLDSFLGYYDPEAPFQRAADRPGPANPHESATIAAVQAGAGVVAALLDAPTPEVRVRAARLLARIGKGADALAQRLEIEADPSVRLTLHVALTVVLGRPAAPEAPDTLASDVLRILTMTYPLDAPTTAALTRVLRAPWMPLLPFAAGLPAQIAAAQIYRMGEPPPELLPIVRGADAENERDTEASSAAHGGVAGPRSAKVLQRLLRWAERTQHAPARSIRPSERWGYRVGEAQAEFTSA
jgi:hypothetical protein